MNSPLSVYRQNIKQYREELSRVKKQLFTFSMLRLAVFLVLAFLVYRFFGNARLLIVSLLIGIGVFLFLVTRHANLRQQKRKLQELILLNETEIEVLHRNFHHLPNGKEFTDATHEFSQDVDLFGDRSFFQYLNRTALLSGKQKLAKFLTSNDIEDIPQKQEAVKELAEKVKFRQEFTAVARIIDTETPPDTILKWFIEYKTFVPLYFRWLPFLFSLISIGLVCLNFFDLVSGYFVAGVFFLGLGITANKLKKINLLSTHLGEIQDTFRQYHQLLDLMEKEAFTSSLLKHRKDRIQQSSRKASGIFRQFSGNIDALDQRNNMIFGVLGNGFLLWDLRQCYKLEKWIKTYRDKVGDWFEIIHFMDAGNSLGNFAFNHPGYVFPEIKPGNTILKTTQAVHPLIDPQEAVRNDYTIQKEEFFIITGANMAGKSTFLRTVSLQIIMANAGLPVCARTCEYTPIKLITSMRTVDSLADEASYFYAELSRLKFIVDEIGKDNYFIILDEILKGTNSTDKAIGSRKFVEKLVASGATGIIATHDLSLCEVADKIDRVKNHYFDAEIINDELHFDYTFKDGICRNMNASFLLRKMEIVDD
ncbi:MutS-related protein [Sinomicrobium weinanense]|uniref:DNA mismatch repair protein MutS n=1 Tax=Sinomicrobium weinanense TaxID=2842200 RepID=A0A926Q3D8_9FLAO|nr:DNA mismatch repair protein MutS [Sinomicrobium weinanense]MBC9795655.1 DNA mismatch repair protein MutS [Sinomicrobium weinanense]MBU3122824.1 DNA mismatch repair protein MutS [Sinomicrobium weinanense]